MKEYDPVSDFVREQPRSSRKSQALRCLRARNGERTKREKIDKELRWLLSEISCRIAHGADSNGHLEYVEKKLEKILKRLS